MVTRKLKYDLPIIRMAGKPIELVNVLKVLGLTIDKSLTFKTHVAAICRRVTDIYKQLACAAKVTWGLNPEIIRTIYVAVVALIVLNASTLSGLISLDLRELESAGLYKHKRNLSNDYRLLGREFEFVL
ncbi:Putative 115 kDa protein in type-1 retrotransposable element R1DM [Eumeta japonica]|uniref:115 kDa protein in type-1 retrotransposable element R1DM n=1 Tax=Eumeta variegata TaxID=151549 RepID=A0A4C1WYJ2_EUMVA|nr:Putative 115 kDa protein in type-1 retrotransposable element R1DM [Eumeta japonica]